MLGLRQLLGAQRVLGSPAQLCAELNQALRLALFGQVLGSWLPSFRLLQRPHVFDTLNYMSGWL